MAEKKSSILDTIKPFAFGGISGCVATSVIQPLDTIKVRIQVMNNQIQAAKKAGKPLEGVSANPFAVAKNIIANSGVKGFYAGLDAALLRQIVYGTIRMGLYKWMVNYIETKNKRHLLYAEKAGASLFSGFIGSIFGNPADLALIRFQADTIAPIEQRRNYRHVGHALSSMIKEEGVLTLWRGVLPSMVRAMMMNFGMMSTYDQVKEMIIHYTGDADSTLTKCISAGTAGVTCSILSLPPDNLKTKLMNMKALEDGTMPYKGIADCFKKTVANEGFFGLWVGIEVYITRVSPHAIIALLTLDYLNLNYGKKNF